ncbi:hypothetical protein [Actinoplanes aureus]|uniref:Uncharacterized protein n=1 Tax=Actinoplanes aureus TaxID=2792083 RepID=A0A931CBH8_9ACTN|nr:hypothetical protein [Actinoplanes aureus]MBG0564083.1 hypothetical protein [Actinoplanes aureus]
MDDEWHISEQRGGPVSHVLLFEEVVASDREDLVAEAVEFLPTVRGVTSVEHVEREIVEIDAPGVPAARLTSILRRWWDAAAKEQRPWMTAMNRAAGTVGDLAPGFQRDGWQLTRVADAELTHVITLDHGFGREPGQHMISITAGVRLTLPDREHVTAVYSTLDLADDAALAEVVTGQVLPALDALPSVDAMLARWQEGRSVEAAGRRPYPGHEGELHGRVLVARGRLAEAREVYQRYYEYSLPRQRPYVVRLVEKLGVAALTTGDDPRLSVADERTLAAWPADMAGRIDLLHRMTGVPMDRSRRSLDEVWARLRETPDRFRSTFADTGPALAIPYYGVQSSGDIRRGRVPFEPWYRVTVELLTAYLGAVVIAERPGTAWGVAGDGELAMVDRGGTGLLSRVFAVARLPFEAPDDEFDPRRLRRLADDMARWLGEGRYEPGIIRLGTPGT